MVVRYLITEHKKSQSHFNVTFRTAANMLFTCLFINAFIYSNVIYLLLHFKILIYVFFFFYLFNGWISNHTEYIFCHLNYAFYVF